MSDGVRLHIMKDGEEIPALTVAGTPVHVGRATDNDLVIADSTVSSRHATFWVDGTHVWVRDRGSKNGTTVNGKRIRGSVQLADGDRIQLGSARDLVLRGEVVERPPNVMARLIEDMEASVRYPLVNDRFYFGPGHHADLDVDGATEGAVSIHPDGEITLSVMDADDVTVAFDEVFEVGGRSFRVIEVPSSYTHTVELEPARFPYRLTVTLDGVTGAQAVVEDTQSGTRHVVEAENRAILLYVLARKHQEARTDPELQGDTWCADEDVSRDIWGRKGTQDANSLHVLVHRLRKELKKAGFDPWFIEKRRKAIRIALQNVVVQ